MNKRYKLLLQVAQIEGSGRHATLHGLAHTQGTTLTDALSLRPLSSFEKYYFLTIGKKRRLSRLTLTFFLGTSLTGFAIGTERYPSVGIRVVLGTTCFHIID
jgi:hypothetical protein